MGCAEWFQGRPSPYDDLMTLIGGIAGSGAAILAILQSWDAEHDEPVMDHGPQTMLSAFELSGTAPTDDVSANYDAVRARGSLLGAQHTVITDELITMTPLSSLLDALRGVTVNPDSLREDGPIQVYDTTNLAIGTYYIVIPMDGYKLFSLDWETSDADGTVTVTLWQANNPAAVGGAIANWKQVVAFGSQVNNAGMFHMGFPFKSGAMMVRIVTAGSATNALELYAYKGN